MLIAQVPTSINVTMPAAAEQISCPAVDQMLKEGAENPVKEVSNVQLILRDIEHMDVLVTGDYDDDTKAAIEQFQQKYASDILGPWGVNGERPPATGIVSLTTAKKLNQLACGAPLTLNSQEMKFISVVGAKAAAAPASDTDVSDTTTVGGGEDATGVALSSDDGSATSTDSGYSYDTSDMTASVAGASTMSRFGWYLKQLFR